MGGGLAVAVAGVATAAAVEDQVFAYYATFIRVPEIAIGVLVAGIWPIAHAATSWGARPGGGQAGLARVAGGRPWGLSAPYRTSRA